MTEFHSDQLQVPHCPVCATPATGDDGLAVRSCPRCGTPHHEDCWDYHGGCAVYGCREQAPPELVEVEAWPQVLRDYRSWLRLMGQTRRATVLFAVSCMLAAHLAVLGLTWGGAASLLLLLAPLLPMVLSGLSWFALERRGLGVRDRLLPVTGEAPFRQGIGRRLAARWLAGARNDLEQGTMGWLRLRLYGPIVLLMALLFIPTAALVGPGPLVFLLLFDLFVLHLTRDSFIDMRQDQSIMVARFEATYAPRLLPGTKDADSEKDLSCDDDVE